MMLTNLLTRLSSPQTSSGYGSSEDELNFLFQRHPTSGLLTPTSDLSSTSSSTSSLWISTSGPLGRTSGLSTPTSGLLTPTTSDEGSCPVTPNHVTSAAVVDFPPPVFDLFDSGSGGDLELAALDGGFFEAAAGMDLGEVCSAVEELTDLRGHLLTCPGLDFELGDSTGHYSESAACIDSDAEGNILAALLKRPRDDLSAHSRYIKTEATSSSRRTSSDPLIASRQMANCSSASGDDDLQLDRLSRLTRSNSSGEETSVVKDELLLGGRRCYRTTSTPATVTRSPATVSRASDDYVRSLSNGNQGDYVIKSSNGYQDDYVVRPGNGNQGEYVIRASNGNRGDYVIRPSNGNQGDGNQGNGNQGGVRVGGGGSGGARETTSNPVRRTSHNNNNNISITHPVESSSSLSSSSSSSAHETTARTRPHHHVTTTGSGGQQSSSATSGSRRRSFFELDDHRYSSSPPRFSDGPCPAKVARLTRTARATSSPRATILETFLLTKEPLRANAGSDAMLAVNDMAQRRRKSSSSSIGGGHFNHDGGKSVLEGLLTETNSYARGGAGRESMHSESAVFDPERRTMSAGSGDGSKSLGSELENRVEGVLGSKISPREQPPPASSSVESGCCIGLLSDHLFGESCDPTQMPLATTDEDDRFDRQEWIPFRLDDRVFSSEVEDILRQHFQSDDLMTHPFLSDLLCEPRTTF